LFFFFGFAVASFLSYNKREGENFLFEQKKTKKQEKEQQRLTVDN